MRLENKVALITGAASGIGFETAKLFAKEGATVIVADMDEELGLEAVVEINKIGKESHFVQVNVTDEAQVKAMVAEIIERYDKIDILFNNAGISGVGVLHEVDYDVWQRVMDVNINGVYLVSKHVVPHMIKAKSGSIINMSSVIAEIGLANRACYAASKGAVAAMTKSMQADYAQYNIRVNSLMPGTIHTPFVDDYIRNAPDPDEMLRNVKSRQLSGELGKPIDVAHAALYLASDESKFMMGSSFVIDGGIAAAK